LHDSRDEVGERSSARRRELQWVIGRALVRPPHHEGEPHGRRLDHRCRSHPARTRQEGQRSLSQIHPQELLAQALQALSARHAFDPKDVEDVVAGCVTAAGEQGACIARMATLAPRWPTDVTGVTLNRFCGSGSRP
jgi:hypothetical protein